MTADQEQPPKAEEKLCFVISPIGGDGSDVRKHADMFLNAIVKQALETEEFGYVVKRADEEPEPGMINDRVIQSILSAPLAVADLTFHNPNVYYELGIRHMAELPVVHFAQEGTKLPFDNAGYRAIQEDVFDWAGQEKARDSLRRAVRAIQKSDYRASNPITHARGTFSLKKSSDPRDWIISDLARMSSEHGEALRVLNRTVMLLLEKEGRRESLSSALLKGPPEKHLGLGGLGGALASGAAGSGLFSSFPDPLELDETSSKG